MILLHHRPPTFEPGEAFGLLRDLLAERSLLGVRLVDSSRVFDCLRMVKALAKVAMLRTDAQLAEEGIRTVMRELRAGQTHTILSETCHASVVAEARRQGVANMTGKWD